jgi:thiamine biosynthesis protein ThiI
MTNLYLVKLGELTLKGGNREEFELRLRNNLRVSLKGSSTSIEMRQGRFFLRCPDTSRERVEQVLSQTFGIAGWALARECPKTAEAVFSMCAKLVGEAAAHGARTFKIEARRTDKSFPLDSYTIMREAGGAVLEALPALRVDVHTPDCRIEVEIREKAYVYGATKQGLRGLPVGSEGRGLLLLSGGIDSPVAGYLMASRGMRLNAIHFHAYPYTSREALEKVATLARLLGRYSMGVELTRIPFTKVQLQIKEKAPASWITLLTRMAMMDIAERLARAVKAQCLVSGESLGQVASQTIENMTCVQSRCTLPILRPLIGTDKIRTIELAKLIGTYETSTLPWEDCCVVFSATHPVLKADVREAQFLFEKLGLEDLLEEAFLSRESTIEGLVGVPGITERQGEPEDHT